MTQTDQRKHPRTPFSLYGAMSFADGVALPFVTRDLSEGGIALSAPASRDPGEKVLLYLEKLGTIEGRVVRSYDGGFAVALTGTPAELVDFAHRLDALYTASPLSLIETPVDALYADLSPELDATAQIDGCDVHGHAPARLNRGAEGELEMEFRVASAA